MLRARGIIILAVTYFLAAKLGLRLAVVHPYATAVWPPAGIALAVLLVFGRGLWPGVALGAYFANLTTGATITHAGALASVGIAMGNTLEAVVGAYLVQRFAGGASAFDRTKDVFRFAILGGLVSTSISASCGVASLSLAGLAKWADARAIGGTWWIGDTCGDLVLAPALILWLRNWRIRWSRQQILEALLAAIAGGILAAIAFTPIVVPHLPGLGLAFLCTPAFLWAAFRLGRRAAATSVLLVNAIALWSAIRGVLATEVPPTYRLVELQAYMAVTSIMMVAVAAEVYQRRRQQVELRLVIDGMPGLVAYLDRDLRYRFVNRTYAEWFGRSLADIERHTMRELAGDQSLDSIRSLLEQAFAGKRVTFERDFAYPDAQRTVRATYVPDCALDGSVRGIVILVQDITAEARGLRALQESEERFRRIVETAAEGIWITGSGGIIAFANRRMGELLGYAPEEITGRACLDFTHPDDRQRAAATFDACNQGDTEWCEYRARRQDGSTIWIQFTGAPIRDGSGYITGVLGMCTDISTRKRAEEMLIQNAEELRGINQALLQSNGELRTTKEHLQLVTDNMAAAVTRCNRDLRYVWVSRGYAAWIERPVEEIAGRLIQDVLGDQGLRDIFPYIQRVLSGDRVEYTTQVNFLGPGHRWIHAIYVPTYTEPPEVDGWIAVVTDITEEKRSTEQMRQTQRLESLGILAGGIAHDFNNLLVGILGNASLALDILGPGTPARTMLQDLISASERAAGLTRQLLAYAGKEQLATRPINVSRLVNELATLLRTSIPKHVYLILELQDSIPKVDADQTQLQQVLMNLVINAAEAIPEGVPGTVKITTSTRQLTPDDATHAVIPLPAAEQTYVALTVSDTGTGMAADIQARIFDPFFTTKFTGRGLGLSAVLGIVKAHQGTITLDSAPGAGTSFTLLLPPNRTAESVEEPRASVLRCTGGTILVVDDEPTVRAVALRALEYYGYKVLLAENGQEAINVLAAHPEIVAIVLDLAMPVMSGDHAAPLLKQQRPELPIILSSGYPEGEAARRFAEHGFTAFLQKPYTSRALPDKIAGALAKRP